MHNLLQQILARKQHELIKFRHGKCNFAQTITEAGYQKEVAIIAEIKLASPTYPCLGSKGQIINRVKQYADAGADAVSVITEKHFFKGDPSFIKIIKNTVSLPVLQKDFVIDEYQIVESKYFGADAILLIARILDQKTLAKFVKFAQKLGIEPVVEVNNEDDLKKVIAAKTQIIAVNARDLDTFEVDVDRACNILRKIPEKFIKLGFSGIHSRTEVKKYQQAGANGILIGTSLMKADNINQYLQHLRGGKTRLHLGGEKSIVKVKICGIRSIEAAKTAIDAGTDFLGFNFVPTSKRYINPLLANKIIQYINTYSSSLDLIGARSNSSRLIARTIKIVGVFQNADVDYVNTLSLSLGLDFVQLHGSEDNAYIKKVRIPVIKSITINSPAEKVKADYLLLDRAERGTGEMIDFKKAAKLSASYRIFYAGGLNPDNVACVIGKVHPFAVDVAGGIETNGIQDIEKIRLFIRNAKESI